MTLLVVFGINSILLCLPNTQAWRALIAFKLTTELSAIPFAAMKLHVPIEAASVNSYFGTHIKETSDSNNSSTNV